MTDGYRNSAGADASTLYAPDVMGDGYNATFLKRADGTTLKYALAAYGTPGPVLGFRDSSGNDVGPKWAAIGSTNYSLPINGNTYISSGVQTGGGSVFAALDFEINTSTWIVTSTGTGAGTVVKASGMTPAGATSIKIVATWLNAPGDSDAGTVTNTCPTYTAIPSSGTVGCQIREGGSTSGQTTYQLIITMENGSSSVISTTTTTFQCITTKD